jgi:hypothetical protein
MKSARAKGIIRAIPPRRNRHHPHIPAWLDTLILWIEVIAVIGTIIAGVYAIVTLFGV